MIKLSSTTNLGKLERIPSFEIFKKKERVLMVVGYINAVCILDTESGEILERIEMKDFKGSGSWCIHLIQDMAMQECLVSEMKSKLFLIRYGGEGFDLEEEFDDSVDVSTNHRFRICSVDDQRFAVVSSGGNTILFFDVPKRKLLFEMTIYETEGFRQSIKEIRSDFSIIPNLLVAKCSTNVVYIIDCENYKILRVFNPNIFITDSNQSSYPIKKPSIKGFSLDYYGRKYCCGILRECEHSGKNELLLVPKTGDIVVKSLESWGKVEGEKMVYLFGESCFFGSITNSKTSGIRRRKFFCYGNEEKIVGDYVSSPYGLQEATVKNSGKDIYYLTGGRSSNINVLLHFVNPNASGRGDKDPDEEERRIYMLNENEDVKKSKIDVGSFIYIPKILFLI